MPSHAVSLNRRHLLAATVLSSLGNASWSQASHWPVKAVKFTVPFPPGGPVDTTARIFTQKLTTMWTQAAIIDNRAGAGGVVGAAAAAKDPADGYNFFVGSIHHAVNPWLMGKLSYDIERDFVPVSFAALFPVFLVAHPSVPANNVKELIALSQKARCSAMAPPAMAAAPTWPANSSTWKPAPSCSTFPTRAVHLP